VNSKALWAPAKSPSRSEDGRQCRLGKIIPQPTADTLLRNDGHRLTSRVQMREPALHSQSCATVTCGRHHGPKARWEPALPSDDEIETWFPIFQDRVVRRLFDEMPRCSRHQNRRWDADRNIDVTNSRRENEFYNRLLNYKSIEVDAVGIISAAQHAPARIEKAKIDRGVSNRHWRKQVAETGRSQQDLG
jgi:hypothetical protein